jgi:hypothetical protein
MAEIGLRRQSGKKRQFFQASRVILGIILLLLWLATYHVANYQAYLRDSQIRQQLLSQVQSLAETVNVGQVNTLTFSVADRSNPQFQRLSQQMRTYVQSLGYRSIYSMTKKGARIIFGPESLEEKDTLASAPGTPYHQPPRGLEKVFSQGVPLIVGPYEDEYGFFISAFAPVTDLRTGQIILVVGMDIEARTWQEELKRVRQLPFWVGLGITVILILGRTIQKKRHPHLGLYRTLPYLVAIAGVLVTFTLAYLLQERETLAHQSSFRQLADTKAQIISQEFKIIQHQSLPYLAELQSLNEEITAVEFRNSLQPLASNSSIYSWQWIEQISAKIKSTVETQLKFVIFEKDKDGNIIPVKPRKKYFPVLHLEPKQAERLGYDLGSDPEQLKTLRVTVQGVS